MALKMERLKQLKEKVDKLYKAKEESRGDWTDWAGWAEWADWLYANHVFVVADIAGKLADKYGANKEVAMAAAMLHDIADTVMKRENPKHEEKTSEIAKKLLKETGFKDDEIKIIIDDAMRFHSCYGNERPQSLEGKVMAAADAVSHLQSDFYPHARVAFSRTKSAEELENWALVHIEKDFNNKIAFEEVKESVRADYEKLRDSFLR